MAQYSTSAVCIAFTALVSPVSTMPPQSHAITIAYCMLQRVSAADKEFQLLQLKTLTPEDLPPDVHTWKWYFACGQRYLVVGTGVRTDGCGMPSIGPHAEAVEVVDSRAHFLCEWKHNAQACICMYSIQYICAQTV